MLRLMDLNRFKLLGGMRSGLLRRWARWGSSSGFTEPAMSFFFSFMMLERFIKVLGGTRGLLHRWGEDINMARKKAPVSALGSQVRGCVRVIGINFNRRAQGSSVFAQGISSNWTHPHVRYRIRLNPGIGYQTIMRLHPVPIQTARTYERPMPTTTSLVATTRGFFIMSWPTLLVLASSNQGIARDFRCTITEIHSPILRHRCS
jgi:hypothetical protein